MLSKRIKVAYAWFEWKTALIFRDFMKERYYEIKEAKE